MDNIINKLYEIRADELCEITKQDRTELLNLCPNYYEDSNLEDLVEGNKTLETAFEKYCLKLSAENSYFSKKSYLTGLKDGLNITKFAKGDEIIDY